MRHLFFFATILFCAAKIFASEPSDTTRLQLASTITSSVGAIAINAAATEILKHSIHELRPDRSANNSFPSRHTSWAFTASTVLSNELYRYSPWWSIGSQVAASAVGIQRIAAGRHWGSDVIAGAVSGIISTELAYFITRKIFKETSPWQNSVPYDFKPTLSVSSQAIYWLNSPDGMTLCTGVGTDIRFRLPVAEHWGLSATARVSSTPVKTLPATPASTLSAVGASVGISGSMNLPGDRLGLVCSLETGCHRWIAKKEIRRSDYSFDVEAAAGLEWHITSSFGCRGAVAYNMATMSSAVHAITLSLSSLVIF